MQKPQAFEEHLTERPKPRGIDVSCSLKHFAIITYAVPRERFAAILPDRFRLNTLELCGREVGLISVVPFLSVDFTSAVVLSLKFAMGQTNYRVYVVDRDSGERCVWFLGTTLDSWTIFVPRHIWKLPWHPGKVRFDCDLDRATGLYRRYAMRTRSHWAEARVELAQSGDEGFDFPGFPDLESALVCLTHPLTGFYRRRDDTLGTYRVWHDKLDVRPATLKSAHFNLLAREGIVTRAEQQAPYSVLVEPINEFTIYLPPRGAA